VNGVFVRFQAPQSLNASSHSIVLDDVSTVMPGKILGGKEDVTQLQTEGMIGAAGSKFYWRQILNK